MRIVIDLDGTICEIREGSTQYSEVAPKPGAIDKINELYNNGHTIIIHTARNMATCESNVGKVLKNIGKVTLDWLEKYNIPYHEIYFGKPNADLYIDDRSLRFENWNSINMDVIFQMAKAK